MSKQGSRQRRRWTAEEKARIVRRHLRDKVSLADLADETGASWSAGLPGSPRGSNMKSLPYS